MGIDEVLIFVIRNKCLGYLLKSIKFVSSCYRIFVANIPIVKQGSVIVCGFGCLHHIPA